MVDYQTVLPLLVAGHFLCDYPLQGDWLSKAKNQKLELVPGEQIWPMALLGHASIHGAMVGLITGMPVLGALEFGIHTITDYIKCDGRVFGYNTDQYIHLGCKLLWAAIFILVQP